jgi:hypothetical protein
MAYRITCLLLLSALVAAGGCKPKETDNPDVASDYRHSKYEQDIETGTYRDETGDQGKGVKPATLAAIDDVIKNTYGPELHQCLEGEMEEHDYQFLRAVFLVEFTIEASGKTKGAKLKALDLSQQDARGQDIGKLASDHLARCIVTEVNGWVFDPAPEVEFVDTYAGKLHEAY